MKTKAFCVLVVILLSGGFYFFQPKEIIVSELSSFNIEALANVESGGKDYCIGTGAIDCRGYKVSFKVTNFSLDME